MLRMILALAVIGLVAVTMFRMMGSQLGSAARVTGADPSASSAATVAPATPRAVVDQTAQAMQQALQQGAAAQAARASEAGQ